MDAATRDLLDLARVFAHQLYHERRPTGEKLVRDLIAEIERLSAPAPSVPEQPKHVPFP